MKRLFLIVCLLLSYLSIGAQGQDLPLKQPYDLEALAVKYDFWTTWLAPEKLFLHMDRTGYLAGETIWFNGYLTNASRRSVKAPSRYIYTELLDSEGKSLLRVKTKAADHSEPRSYESFPGYLDLPEDLADGDYTLRSYTLWQTEDAPEFMFSQKVHIYGPKTDKKTVSTAAERIDISFYPEGGRYFTGTLSRIGFKAMDERGRSVEIEGRIVDQTGEEICTLTTVHDGMGAINIFANPGKSYSLVLDDGSRFPLPDPAADGASIGVVQQSERTVVSICGKAEGIHTLLLFDMENFWKIADLELDGSQKIIRIANSNLRDGVSKLMLVDNEGRILSERPFYRYADTEVKVQAELVGIDGKKATPVTRRTKPARRSELRARINLSEADGDALEGDFSISVVRGSLRSHRQDDNLLSFLGLGSELRGKVNDPRWYFDQAVPATERARALDLLMLIQGWSYYDLPKLLTPSGQISRKHHREYQQFFNVHIDRAVGSKDPRKFSLFVLSPQIKMQHYLEVEEGRNFIIDSLDFQEGTGFLVKVGRKGMGLNYIPKVDPETFAPAFRYLPAPGIAYAEMPQTERIPLVYNEVTDTLAAAVITADEFGTVNGRIVSNEEMNFFRSYSFMDFLRIKAPYFNYDGEYMYNTKGVQGSFEMVQTNEETGETQLANGGSVNVVKLVVDGNAQDWWMFDSMHMDDISSVEISTLADSYWNAGGGVVSIKLRSGARIEASSETQPSLVYFVPLGYQQPKRFYSPQYAEAIDDGHFDDRNTILWKVGVATSDGKAVVRFYDTDQQDYPYLLRVEGFTKDGRPFSLEKLIGE